jgi:uncharacterized protein
MDPETPNERPMTFASAVGWVAMATFLFLTAGRICARHLPGFEQNILAHLGCQLAGYVPVIVAIRILHERGQGTGAFLSARRTHPAFYPLAVLLGLSLVLPASAMLDALLRRYPAEADKFPRLVAEAALPERIAIGFGIVFLGPLVEELLFRAAIIRPLLRSHAKGLVIALTAVLFALSHLQWQRFLPIGIVGAALGFVRVESGSLGPPLLLHAAFNALPFYLMVVSKPGEKGDSGPMALWMVALGLVATAISVELVRAVGRSEAAARARAEDAA